MYEEDGHAQSSHTLEGEGYASRAERANREFTVSGPNVPWVLSDLTYMARDRQMADAAVVIGAYTHRIVGVGPYDEAVSDRELSKSQSRSPGASHDHRHCS